MLKSLPRNFIRPCGKRRKESFGGSSVRFWPKPCDFAVARPKRTKDRRIHAMRTILSNLADFGPDAGVRSFRQSSAGAAGFITVCDAVLPAPKSLSGRI